MEQNNRRLEEEEVVRAAAELAGDGGNGQLIYLGITDALAEDRAIDHVTVRFIAEQLGVERGSKLHVLATSGEIARGLTAELEAWRARAPVELEPWIDALEEYVQVRTDPRPIEGWHFLWPRALIKRRPAAQVGRTRELGWFGQFRHDDQPGGFIFTVDELGCRTFTEADSNPELERQWARIQEEYAYFYRVRGGQDSQSPDKEQT
jgi:hypothetical protein